jgi:hypothetical protein
MSQPDESTELRLIDLYGFRKLVLSKWWFALIFIPYRRKLNFNFIPNFLNDT